MDYNLNIYSGGDETLLEQVENRIEVDDFNKYPFNAVGKIIAYFDTIIKGQLKQVMKSGTGTLISEKVVLTSAHTFYQNGTKAKKVLFYPFCQQKSEDTQLKHVKVKQFCIHPLYTAKNHDYPQRYDMCLMILENNNLIKFNSPIKLKFDYAKWRQPEDHVMVVGYPSDRQKSSKIQSAQNNRLFYESRTPAKQEQTFFLYYMHLTSPGNSGGPIFVTQEQKYEIIGIHKAGLANTNYGLLINDMPNTKQILSELIEMNNLEGMMGGIYQPTYKKLLQSEKKLRDQNQKLKKENQDLKQQIQKLLSYLTLQKKLEFYKFSIEKCANRILSLKEESLIIQRQERNNVFISFLDNLKTYKFTEMIKKQNGRKYHIVMGMISGGKSSLLKKITGIKLKTGLGRTTSEVLKIAEYKNQGQTIQIFDSPGLDNEEFSCLDPKILMLLYAMDEVFIVYRDSLKYVDQLMRIIRVIKPNKKLKLIRTHCDLFDYDDQITCDQEVQKDYSYMKQLGISCEIFCFSARKDMNFMDNKKVADLLKGQRS